ncbi:hypothetical protein AXF42_Ash017746 [Apostasia shenzhenica]|uniref:PCI domain-containing protein n=1 Tax=Apostasia shenzhenica TaxID=1088818 RepID=A0A2I0B649_9ASPA|nr:hypothetical protein AXF42_Ash017746 [Apostasia shenzhenica]
MAMENQRSEQIPGVDPNSMEKCPANVASQGHASVVVGQCSWPSSNEQVSVSWNYGANNGLENSTSLSSVHHYDPLRDSAGSESVHTGTASYPSASSNLAATNTSQDYAGYVPYSSSSYHYGYGNMEYQSNYYGYAQQAGYASYQQAGASPNSGAAYQSQSSFQNTGSYAAPTSYSGTYYASGNQMAAGYPNNSYWNGVSAGGYPLQYSNYSSSDTHSAPSASLAGAGSFPYQQDCNQWSVNYGTSMSNVNYTFEPGNIVNGTVPSTTFPVQSAIGGYSYASSQPPPPGTTSWKRDLGSSDLTSTKVQTDVIARYSKGIWEEKPPAAQNYHPNQNTVQFQIPLNSKPIVHENHAQSDKTTSPQGASLSLQVSSNIHVSQPFQTVATVDARRVSKMQIPTNPRIASSMTLGMPKLDKESSTTNTTAKPAYIPVQVPKPTNHVPSNDDTDAVIKMGVFPPTVRAYVERCFSRCKDDTQRAANKLMLSEIIAKAKEDGSLWTKNWDMETLFPLPNSASNAADQNTLQHIIPSMPKLPSRRIKSRWEPIADEKLDDKVLSVNHDTTKNISWAEKMNGSRMLENKDNGWKATKFYLTQQQTQLSNTTQRPLKKPRITDNLNITENGDTSSDSDKEQELTRHYSTAIALANSPEEKKKRENRSKRFEKAQASQVDVKLFKPKGSPVGNLYLRRASAMLLAKNYDDRSSRAVEDIDWDALTVKGTCQEVEKRYLRLTSAPDPATVRPEEVLEKALHMVRSSQKNYLYKCDQLKSIRQDLTVQRIQNELTVKVYETHARLALGAGDLPEYNQCQSQLKRLYADGIKGCHMEFSAYNLLCVILHSNNKRDLFSSMKSLSSDAKLDDAVKHALAVHSAVSSGNYVLFFRLYKTAPNLNTCLMDLHVEKMRFEAIKCMSKSYRPTIPLTYITRVLGFSSLVQTGDCEVKDANGLEESEEWLRAHGAVLIVDNSGEMQLDTKASSATLYMPEPEDAVAHGDTNLAVDNFLTRAT